MLLAWAGLDYFLQRRNYERSLRMTKQEVKQEPKDTDGNPLIRGRMRRLRRALLRKILAKDVQRATAVITNPTHYAVAIEYRPETMAAPVVVAKGRNLLAQKNQAASPAGTKFPSSKIRVLAQALYKTTEVGQAIPPKLYAAVAEILAFLYRAQARLLAAQPEGGELTHGRHAPAPRLPPRPGHASAASFDWLLPVAAVCMVFMMLVPVPSLVLDLFLATSVTLGVIVLLSRPLHPQAGAVLGLPHTAADSDPVAHLAQYRQQPPHPAARQRRHRRGRARDRGLRAVRGGRQLRGGLRDFPGLDRHSVSGHQPRRGAHRRSGRALHLGRSARQADGHRRGHERRPDRRSPGARPPRT